MAANVEKKALKDLLETGKQKGSLSNKEILYALDDITLEPEEMERFYEALEEAGVEIVEDSLEDELADINVEAIHNTENGVANLYVTKEIQEQWSLSAEQASNSVGFMDSIKGCLCWMAFIDNCDEENTIRGRLRSRFVAINTIAERYRGGGHACASGATVYGQDEVQALLADTDALVKEYKETHEGWL